MRGNESIRAWRPAVPGVREVLHAHMEGHRYPSHAHGDWALMVIDQGAVAYDLGGRARIADGGAATLLPPGVAHDGRAAPRSAGFRKRVAYLDAAWVSEELSGSVVDRPARPDLLAPTRRLHDALGRPGDELAAEVALLDIAALVGGGRSGHRSDRVDHSLAARLRALLESRLLDGTTLAEAGAVLGAHPGHLSRSFSSAYGLPPHRYLTSRRVDVARRLLLSGRSPAEAATLAGFYDQAHLTRHFRKVLGATPRAFATSASGSR